MTNPAVLRRARGRLLLAAVASMLGMMLTASPAPAQQWVTPAVSAPRVQQVIFQSTAVGGPVSYHVYTPPEYDTDPARRFPVLYWLHGANSVLTGITPVSAWFDAAIASGRIRPMIVVFPNGLPLGMWCNWASGAAPIEDILVQDLIPDVDARLRTIAVQSGRIIEGFSMGGYGAARIGFRHNHLFGGISFLGAGPLQLDFLAEVPGSPVTPQQRAQIFQQVYGNSQEIYLAQSPWMLAQVHRDQLLAAGIPIRQLIGSLDFTLPANLDFHQRLLDLALPHAFFNPPGVGHDVLGLFNAYGEANWPFYHAVFGAPAPRCAGDANSDNLVNAADLSVLLGQFSQTVAPGAGADFNADGLINGADLSVLLSRFNAGC